MSLKKQRYELSGSEKKTARNLGIVLDETSSILGASPVANMQHTMPSTIKIDSQEVWPGTFPVPALFDV